MDLFISSYKKLSKEELESIITDLPSICLKGKRELAEGGKKGLVKLDTETIDNIDALAHADHISEIQLNKLDSLGFTYDESGDEKTFKRSRRSKQSNAAALFWGIVFSLAIFGALAIWGETLKADELAFGKLFIASVLTALGLYGINLLIKTTDRIIRFRGFSLIKTKKETTLIFREDTDLTTRRFSAESYFELIEKEENVSILSLSDSTQQVDIYEYKMLNHEQKELLRKLCATF